MTDRKRSVFDDDFEAGYVPCDEPPGMEEREYAAWKAAGGTVKNPAAAAKEWEGPKTVQEARCFDQGFKSGLTVYARERGDSTLLAENERLRRLFDAHNVRMQAIMPVAVAGTPDRMKSILQVSQIAALLLCHDVDTSVQMAVKTAREIVDEVMRTEPR